MKILIFALVSINIFAQSASYECDSIGKEDLNIFIEFQKISNEVQLKNFHAFDSQGVNVVNTNFNFNLIKYSIITKYDAAYTMDGRHELTLEAQGKNAKKIRKFKKSFKASFYTLDDKGYVILDDIPIYCLRK